MRSRRSKTSGFTLLELILVMGILVFVVAMIAPSLRGFGVGRRNNDMATLIVSLANYARTQSVTEARTYRLNFDPNGTAVWLTVDSGGGIFQPAANDFGNRQDLVDGITLRTDINMLQQQQNQQNQNQPQAAGQQQGTYVEFHADGRNDPAHIWLTDKFGGQIEVGCESMTELFRIIPPQEMTR